MPFKPCYKITPQLLKNIKQVSVLNAKLNDKNFPQVVFARLEKTAREISTYASTSIEGNPLPLTDVRRLLKNMPQNLRDSEREVLNYNKALLQANAYIQTGQAPTLDFILAIHKTVETGLLDKFRLGRLRKEPVFVNDPKLRKTVYWPPDHQDVPKLLRELLDYAQSNFDELDPLLLAGIFHKQFVIIHPFIDGNGRTARLVTKVLLALLGLNTFKLFSFENYYNNNVTKYFSRVGTLGNYYTAVKTVDFTEWLEYFTDGIVDELLRISKEIQKISVNPQNELKEQHQTILKYIKQKGYITDKIYAVLTKRAKASRHLDFQKLTTLGFIVKQGNGKNSYYILNDAVT
ncbi:MAG: Fic family protein [Candidatus Margulisbacteria bacterium]|jgi:Fic family protein|nr:Fic family protein [Candidatus Margulisiibacteriota bacterium]